MNGPVVLPGPPLALPEADELVMLPDGKLEAGIDPGAKLMKRALVPAKPPTVLKAPPVASPRGRGIDAAEVGADEAADDVAVAGAGDARTRRRDRGRDGAEVHAGESAEIAVAGAADRRRIETELDDRAAGQAGKPADDAVGSGAGD